MCEKPEIGEMRERAVELTFCFEPNNKFLAVTPYVVEFNDDDVKQHRIILYAQGSEYT